MRSRYPLPCFAIVVGLFTRFRRDSAVDHRLDHRLAHPRAPLVPAYRLAGPGVGMPLLVRLTRVFDDWLPFGGGVMLT